MFPTQSPGAQSTRQHRLPNGVNTTGPHQRRYAYHASSAGANASAYHPRTGQHVVPASPDIQQLGAWKNWNRCANPASAATTEHNPLPEKVKLRCPIHAGPDGHLKCWYRGNGFPDMLKVREHVAWKHPSLCPACKKLLVGPSSWNAHRKARAEGRECPVADRTPDDAMGPLWQSIEVLDDFHRRRPVKDDNTEDGKARAWEKQYRQLHNVSSDELVPSPFHNYATASSSVTAGNSPSPSAPLPSAFTPDTAHTSRPLASIDEAFFGTPGDADMADADYSEQWTTFTPSAVAQAHEKTPQQQVDAIALYGSALPQRSAAPGVFESADTSVGASGPANHGGNQNAYNDFEMVAEGSISAPQTQCPSSFASDVSLTGEQLTPESHIFHAQSSLRCFEHIPEADAALKHLQCALDQLRAANVARDYWQSKAFQASNAEHLLKINIATTLTGAVDQYSSQGGLAQTLEELSGIGDHLRDNINKVIKWLKRG